MTLKGSVSGSTRAEMMTAAQDAAANYLGTECVEITLVDERVAEDQIPTDPERVSFAAEFYADEHHDLERRSYGPDQCRKCGKQSWPQNPLP